MPETTQELTKVYIDESGGLMGADSSDRFYVITAILVFKGEEQLLEDGIREVCRLHRNGATLKSSKIGGRDELRLKCLQGICRLPFVYIALAVDKQRLMTGTGLQYRKSRYKYLHERLNQYLSQSYSPVTIVIDNHGTEEFQQGCCAYFEKKHQKNLFGTIDFRYVEDQSEPCVQLADFIGGTLLQCVDPKKRTSYFQQYRTLLQNKESLLAFFPSGYMQASGPTPPGVCPDVEKLRALLNNKAYSFLEQHENDTDEKRKMQVYTLRRLYDVSSFESADQRSIFSDQLIRELRDQEYQLSPRAFTGDVIGGLRKEGIIISGSPSGYKLALSLEDINEYLDHDRNIIVPMLQKLTLARRTPREGINFDILIDARYSVLKILIEAIGANDMESFGSEHELDVETIKFL